MKKITQTLQYEGDNRYELTEVLGGYSSVIKYGDVCTVRENEICFSRNGRIDDILN